MEKLPLMPSSRNCRRASGASVLLAALLCAAPLAHAAPQQDPELRAVLAKAIASAECFPDKYQSEVWHHFLEPKLRKVMKDPDERMRVIKAVFCEANRPGEQRLAPGLVLAVIEVESRFDRWAVSSAGAVGLMQVMPFWPAELGMTRRDLTHIEANMRMGCAILRHYLAREKNDVNKALARYNGSVGKRTYSDKVVQRWTTKWHGADDPGFRTAQR
jgi:hypothetical protein